MDPGSLFYRMVKLYAVGVVLAAVVIAYVLVGPTVTYSRETVAMWMSLVAFGGMVVLSVMTFAGTT